MGISSSPFPGITHENPRTTSYTPPSPVPTASVHELLIVDEESNAASYVAALRASYRVATTAAADVALQYLNKATPSLVMADLDLLNGDGTAICRTAKSLPTPATVLVTTSQVEGVPELLQVGCDAVLLKPFAPNLLYARIGRLLRGRSEQLRMRARRAEIGAMPFSPRPDPPLASTNRTWPDTHCPACSHDGAVSFEFSSHRRSWYACLACKNVWIAKRQE